MAAAGGLLAAGGAVQGCGAPAPASPAPPPGAPAALASQAGAAGSTDWDRLLAAAKQEGKVNVIVPPGDVYRGIAAEFEKK
jgi:hypothetical protein